jgi:hypothetical protein
VPARRRGDEAFGMSSQPPARDRPPDFISHVMAERDRRAADPYVTGLWRWADNQKKGRQHKMTAFVADVWAASVLLEWREGAENATPTRIAQWMTENGRTYGYPPGSLRTMIYRARKRIELTEAAEPPPGMNWQGWMPIDLKAWSDT